MKDDQVEGTLVIGPANVIEKANAAACTLLGYSKDELVGLHGSELILPEEQPATAAGVDRMRRGQLIVGTGRLKRKDGSVIEVEVRGQPQTRGRITLFVRKLR